MSVVNETDLMTTAQAKSHVKSIRTNKQDLKHRLLGLIDGFQCLDHVAQMTGVVTKDFSFFKRVPIQPAMSFLEEDDAGNNDSGLQEVVKVLESSCSELETEVIPMVTQWRNQWMLRVLVVEAALLILLALFIAGLLHFVAAGQAISFTDFSHTLFYQRPVFSLLAGLLLLSFLVFMHFSIRHLVAKQFINEISRKSSEYDYAKAFLMNTRIYHSIFRPDIVGWNWFNRKCLQNIKQG